MSSSLLDYNLDEIPKLGSKAEDEYKVRIESSEVKSGSSNGKDWVRLGLRLSITEHADANDFFHTVWLPTPDSDEKSRVNTLNRYRDFLEAFGVDPSNPPSEAEDLIGSEAWAILGEKDYEGSPQNYVKRFIAVK